MNLLQREADLLDEHRLQSRRCAAANAGSSASSCPTHPGPLRPLPEYTNTVPGLQGPSCASTTPAAGLPAARAVSPAMAWARVAGADGGELGVLGAVVVEGVGHSDSATCGSVVGHPVGQHPRPARRCVGGLARHHQRGHRRVRCRWVTGHHGGGLLDHHVGVGAAEPERRDPGPSRTLRPGPIRCARQPLSTAACRTGCAGWGSGSRGWPESCRCCTASTALMNPAMPAAASRWPRLDLTAPTSSGASAGTAAAQHGAERAGLDGIAQQRAGAVGLDVVDVAGFDAGVGVGRAQHRHLGGRVGGHQSVGAAVLVDRRTADDRQHPVAVALRRR